MIISLVNLNFYKCVCVVVCAVCVCVMCFYFGIVHKCLHTISLCGWTPTIVTITVFMFSFLTETDSAFLSSFFLQMNCKFAIVI